MGVHPTSRVPVTDGADVAVHQLADGDVDLLLLHATGLHGHVWLPVVEHLPRDRFRVLALDVRGHGASGSLSGEEVTWPALAGDVLAVVDALALHRPLAVGHSSGASLLLLAEEERPGTFDGLCCIEPIATTADEPAPPNPDHPLAEGARRRREVFPSRQAAFDTYATKPPFSTVTPEALWAYVEHGFGDIPEAEGGGVRLRCRPATEAAMYSHGLSHHLYRDLDRVRCPVVLALGELSLAVSKEAMAQWVTRLADARIETLAGLGHFAPLEDPAVVARVVDRAFAV